jgi:hypothetical protein
MKNELNWLAGIIDGEGCLGLYKKERGDGTWKITPLVNISNCDPNIINQVDRISRNIGTPMFMRERIGGQSSNATASHKPHWSTNYILTLESLESCHKFLEQVAPYLRSTKKSVAQLILRYCVARNMGKGRQKYSNAEMQIYLKVKALVERKKDNKKLLPSETTSNSLIKSDDIVRPTAKSVEVDRNVLLS